ncbi:MAG: hypothetical protein KAR06_06490, partial [Deltaproteobacteria bacterium]|nr:hypothetical protein [Deltaproteobacteria bacterium]
MFPEILEGWKEIAEFMGKKADAVRRLYKKEGLPVAKIGRRIYTTQTLLSKWVVRNIANVSERL